jgi:hypothetical protein
MEVHRPRPERQVGRASSWKSAELERHFTAEGNRLAARVANALVDGYEVQFSSCEPGVRPRRFRGSHPSLPVPCPALACPGDCFTARCPSVHVRRR